MLRTRTAMAVSRAPPKRRTRRAAPSPRPTPSWSGPRPLTSSAGEWSAACGRLAARGLVDEGGEATEAGRDLRRSVERHTDQLAAAPWRFLGPDGTGRLADLLGEFWVAVLSSGLLPSETTLGIGKV